MGQMNPHLRDVSEFTHKLWDHLFIMADFDLDVDSPYPLPEVEKLQAKPEKIEYPKNEILFSFYGVNIENMIKLDGKSVTEHLIVPYTSTSNKEYKACSQLSKKFGIEDLTIPFPDIKLDLEDSD